MRYWVYINDKVEGPFEEDKLVTLEGFTPDTLICSETTEAGANQEWVKASVMFEFDPLESTITRALPTPEELNTAVASAGTTDPNLTQALKEAHFVSQNQAQDAASLPADATKLILEKLDSLTREIEGLKQKMEDVISAASYSQTPSFNTQHTVNTQSIPAPEVDMAANTITLTNRDMSQANIPMDDSAAVTESLVTQAESLVAQANQQTENKNENFLNGIDLSSGDTSSTPAELPLGGKGEEEVVLRSALDSLYGAKIQEEQTEKEKESTFQDLLRPRKPEETPTQGAQSAPELAEAAKPQEEPAATQQQKEEVLQQFAPSEHKDFIAEALAEAEKENKAKQEAASAPKEEAPAQPLDGLTPVTPEQEAAIKQDLPQPENEVPVLPIGGAEQEPASKQEAQAEAAPAMADLPQTQAEEEKQESVRDMGEEVPLKTVSAMLPGLASLGGAEPAPAGSQQPLEINPAAAQQEDAVTETIQELVPGAALDKTVPPVSLDKKAPKQEQEENANLLSADDLKAADDSAFTAEEEALFESPVPKAAQPNNVEEPQTQPQPAQEPQGLASLEPVAAQPEAAEQPVAQGGPQTLEEQLPPANDLDKTTTQAEYTPNDLTEIELKEGSTYLISDFVPPAQASDFAAVAQEAMVKSQAALKEDKAAPAKKAEELVVEEVVPSKNSNNAQQAQSAPAPETPVPGADVTVSQIILENTIKTKRGAALDIKTVPMVKDPAESQRLDLSDTELQDVTMQHDLKSADIPSSGKKTKTLVMAVMLLVLIGAIYAGVAYLQLIPDNINFINPKPAVSAQEQEQLNEMLPAAEAQAAQPAAQQISPADRALAEVKNYALPNGMTLEQLIISRHPNAGNMIEWSISSAVDPDNYSVMAKVPPENPQSFKISYRFNYNTVTKALEPTISDSKNLLMSVGVGAGLPAANMQQPMSQQQAMQMNAAQQQALRQQQLAMQQAQQRASAQAVPPAPRQAASAQRPVR